MKLLAVDPGKRWCGLSTWDERGLQRAVLVKTLAPEMEGPQAWSWMASAVCSWISPWRYDLSCVAVEMPGAYGTDRPHKTLDLQNLVGVAAMIFAYFPGAYWKSPRPSDWQGGGIKRDKRHPERDPIVQKIRSRLSEEELRRVDLPAESLATNVWDSVGIGLHALGRLEKRRIISRS